MQLQAALQREPLVSQISPTELSSCRPSPCGVSEFYVISMSTISSAAYPRFFPLLFLKFG